MTDAELADELEQRVEQVVDGEFELGLMIRVDSELPRIIAALRRQPPETLKAAYFEGYEDAMKDRQPSSDQVLVPREPTKAMKAAGARWARGNTATNDPSVEAAAVYRAMLAAAEAEGRKA